jgi:hypothetical protein
MLFRVLHTLLLALILPVTAIAILAVIEMITKDDPVDEPPDWTRPYLPRQNRKQRH